MNRLSGLQLLQERRNYFWDRAQRWLDGSSRFAEDLDFDASARVFAELPPRDAGSPAPLGGSMEILGEVLYGRDRETTLAARARR